MAWRLDPWNDQDVSYSLLRPEEEQWKRSENVRFSVQAGESGAANFLRRAGGQFRHVRRVRFDCISRQHFTLQLSLVANAAALQTINFTTVLNEENAVEFSSWLPHVPQLQYLRIFVDSNFSDATNETLQHSIALNLSNLRGFSLNTVVTAPKAIESTLRMISSLLQKSLVAIELNLNQSVFLPLCLMLQQYGSKVRLLACFAMYLETVSESEQFVLAIERMPFLEEMNIHVETSAGVEKIISFFESAFRPLVRFEPRFSLSVLSADQMQRLFSALRKNTRLQHLSVADLACQALLQSGLAAEGWLTSFSMGMSPSKDLLDIVQKNCSMHSRCRQTCLRLLLIRKHKIALSLIPFELILNIARYLWETRNRGDVWDQTSIEKMMR